MKKILILILLLNIISPINSYSAKISESTTVKVAKSKKNKKVKKSKKNKKVKKSKNSISFKNCKEAKANGYSNIREGEPGYSRKLDKDGDGIACETR